MSTTTALDLTKPYDLNPDSLRHFTENGWVLLRSVCAPGEAEAYGEIIRQAAIAHNRETRPLDQRDTYGKAFLQVMNLWRVDPEVRAFTLAKRFAGIAAKLLGVEKVRLYHDQALFKEPRGGPTPWHQDGYFWPLPQNKTVTMWMPLVDVPANMGSMSFADGSHHDPILHLSDGISDNSQAFYEGYVLGKGYQVRTSGAMAAGDATFHSGITLHRAPNNPTPQMREVMTIIYYADGVTIQEPTNANQEVDLAGWFPGLKPGDVAATDMNPLI